MLTLPNLPTDSNVFKMLVLRWTSLDPFMLGAHATKIQTLKPTVDPKHYVYSLSKSANSTSLPCLSLLQIVQMPAIQY
jgi:hypothetical protein